MPEGIRLLAWTPKEPPVAITTWAVVNDVLPFIRTTLGQLEAALRGDNWLACNWSVRELVDRLGQCGVKVGVLAYLITHDEQYNSSDSGLKKEIPERMGGEEIADECWIIHYIPLS
jgi:hypothetical protein